MPPDIRSALRLPRKRPGLAALAVATLALVIGLSVTVRTLVDRLAFADLPFPHADRIVAVEPDEPDGLGTTSADLFHAWREEARSLETVVGYSMVYGFTTAEPTGVTRVYPAAQVGWRFFDLAPVTPTRGRTFLPEDHAPGAPPVALLGADAVADLFTGAADPDPLGTTVRVNGRSATVVGVLPPGYGFPHSQRVWLPLATDSRAEVEIIGRLRPGMTAAEARVELGRLAAALLGNEPEPPRVKGFARAKTDPRLVAALGPLGLAAFLVLLVGSLNVAGLFTTHTLRHRDRLATATALGASRGRLVVRAWLEVVAVTLPGAGLGLVLSWAGLRGIRWALEPLDVLDGFWLDLRPDAGWVLTVITVALGVSLAATALPMLHILRTRPTEVLRQSTGATAGRTANRALSGLVVLEVASACCLLMTSALLLLTSSRLRSLDPGFESRDLLTGRVSTVQAVGSEERDDLRFFTELETRLEALPRVEAVGFTTAIPSREPFWAQIAGAPVRRYVVSAGYLDTLGVRTLRGRSFDAADTLETAPVALVNQAFVDDVLGKGEVMEREIRMEAQGEDPRSLRVVGVVPDLVAGEVEDERSAAALYLPLSQRPRASMELVLRTRGADPSTLVPELREAVAAVDPRAATFFTMPMEHVLRKRRWIYDSLTTLFGIFGVVALVLAAVGIGGVVGVDVSGRRREHAVRLALGSSPIALFRRVVEGVLGRVGLGLALGLLLSWGMARFLASRVYGLATDAPWVALLIAAVLLTAAVAAALGPALRAASTDPVEALREG